MTMCRYHCVLLCNSFLRYNDKNYHNSIIPNDFKENDHNTKLSVSLIINIVIIFIVYISTIHHMLYSAGVVLL